MVDEKLLELLAPFPASPARLRGPGRTAAAGSPSRSISVTSAPAFAAPSTAMATSFLLNDSLRRLPAKARIRGCIVLAPSWLVKLFLSQRPSRTCSHMSINPPITGPRSRLNVGSRRPRNCTCRLDARYAPPCLARPPAPSDEVLEGGDLRPLPPFGGSATGGLLESPRANSKAV